MTVAQGFSSYVVREDNLVNLDVLNLMVRIGQDLPFIVNPVGVLLLRVCWENREQTVEEESEESTIIKLEAKELENALFESKTTIL